METETSKAKNPKNGVTNGIIKNFYSQWPDNLTVLDLSNRNIVDFEETVSLPPKLADLNLSHNILHDVPPAVISLENLKRLNLSHNNLQFFDETPKFCNSIEELNLSHNRLLGPPYWVWAESPSNLFRMDLSSNMNLTHTLTDDYIAELYQYKTLVTEVIIYNCRIRQNLEIWSTFSNAKTLVIGCPDLTVYGSNHIGCVPIEGLDQCCDIERLNLSNTQISSIEPGIEIYTLLIEINLSHNNISGIPSQFCRLENLEVCILSFNNILYLPDDMIKLKKLTCLKLDSNGLCMLPEKLCNLTNLKKLDLYDNSLYEVDDAVINIEELDLAQNYMEEPDDAGYLEKRDKLRLNIEDRRNGRKPELSIPEPDNEGSPCTSEDEDLVNSMNDLTTPCALDRECTSSPEDWDSDEYWVPRYYHNEQASHIPWMHFVKRKMQEGSFCPIDLHTVPVAETVRYEKMCNPETVKIVDGQFDDISSDES